MQRLKEIAKFNSVKELINTRSQAYKKLKVNAASLGEEEAVRFIQENPSVMLRPILTDGVSAVIGFGEADYKAFLKDAAVKDAADKNELIKDKKGKKSRVDK